MIQPALPFASVAPPRPRRTLTQCDQVLEAITHGSLTPLEALERFGCFRLGARIWELKKRGYPIKCEMVEVKTRDGGTATVARYSLEAGQ